MRNTWVINPSAWDNDLKGSLIPDTAREASASHEKASQGALKDEPAAHQLVGEVRAHQG